jgi:hypothetical protein
VKNKNYGSRKARKGFRKEPQRDFAFLCGSLRCIFLCPDAYRDERYLSKNSNKDYLGQGGLLGHKRKP